jgi:hypothetical protein
LIGPFTSLDIQLAAQDDGEFVEVRPLAGFIPPGWANHAYVGGHFELEQSDMIFTPFSGPVLWIGREKIMIESLLPRAEFLGPVDRTGSWLLHPQADLAMKKPLEILTAREAKMAQFNPCDEPLAFSASLGLCRIQSRETRSSPSLVDLIRHDLVMSDPI